jgi:hypothetical protein
MMMMRRVRLVRCAGGLCAATALAGCGGNASASHGSEIFTAQANRICSQYYDGMYALAGPRGVAGVRRFLLEKQRLGARRLSELRALSPPAAVRSAYENYVGNLGTLEREVRVFLARADAGYAPAPAIKRRLGRLAEKAYAEPRALGLEKCAKNPLTASHTESE